MERLILLVLALLFISAPTLVSYVRKRLRKRKARRAAEAGKRGGPDAQKNQGGESPRSSDRVTTIFPDETAHARFPDAVPDVGSREAQRRPPADWAGVETASGRGTSVGRTSATKRSGQPGAGAERIVERLDRLPPLQRAVVWSEILGRPKALRDDEPPHR